MLWTEAQQLVRGRIEEEFTSGYPTLRRIPSEHTWRHLVALDVLGPNDRANLFEILAERACLFLETEIDSAEWNRRYAESRKNPTLERYRNSTALHLPWKYADPRYMRKCLNECRRFRGASGWLDFSPVRLAVVEAAEPPKKCTAAKVRATIKRSFKDRFQIRQVIAKHGLWFCPGEFSGRPFTLTLEWSWMGGPLYGLVVGRHILDRTAPPIAWETILGFGTGRWDFLCEHNLSDSVELLGEMIETALTVLPNTILR